MSRNYDNWERLVAAVVKRDQIWQLCHQDSISVCSESDLELGFPVSLGSFGITENFEFGATNLQEYFGRGPKAAIKFLDAVNLTEKEFEQQMIFLGNCRHENVGTPWAYYFSHATKLVVYDYDSRRSVFHMLHASKGSSRPNWESRLRIAVGAARGIAHIHAQCGGKLFHGNIESSNIFLNRQQYGCVSVDFSLGRPQPSSDDEFQKRDVYSFGLLLLELVTRGKHAPPSYIVDHLLDFEPCKGDLNWFELGRRYVVDELDMVQDEVKFPFIDWELLEEDDLWVHEMVLKTLQVAKRCLAVSPPHRPTMSAVMLMLDSITIRAPTIITPKFKDLSAPKKKAWGIFLPSTTKQSKPETVLSAMIRVVRNHPYKTSL
ncbi:hypothetical protein C2S52_012756 [Perilla frutescens var. hirtella]|nr:hypothetical protein C2S52_012756 [Perilla frutescens var. hirtella]